MLQVGLEGSIKERGGTVKGLVLALLVHQLVRPRAPLQALLLEHLLEHLPEPLLELQLEHLLGHQDQDKVNLR